MPLKRLPSFPFPQTKSRATSRDTTALNSKPFKCAVIGGGPSGYFAAIHVSEKLEEYGISHEVDILEGTGKTLQKVRISGGGRCNLLPDTELDLRDNILKCYPRGERELYGPMMRYKPSEILDWFNSRGVETKTEADGRTFPVTDSSQTVIDCLVSSLTPSISVHLKTPITSISKNEDGTYALQTPSGTSTFSSIVFATGSSRSGYTLLQNLNHTLIPPLPSLFTLNSDLIKTGPFSTLSGVSLPHVLCTFNSNSSKITTRGPLLFTHVGLSGPCVLKMSSYAARTLHSLKYETTLTLNFVPGTDSLKLLNEYKTLNPKRKIRGPTPECFKDHGIPKRLWLKLLDNIEIQDKIYAELSKKDLLKISNVLEEFKLHVKGKNTNKDEFVTCGGVDLKEVNFKNMESKVQRGCFVVGECLDVDAVTGGYNFLNCWVGGKVAGKGVADYALENYKG
ncbi:hypothetical protein TrVE_jg13739 [Triparma verrucosa]|uniref:Uncharacterized protein n=1 Tax=Triparma verrucosa TaxID=1606542 RepID=A0A9W7CMK3_9STRA|nr:hypothetical protein TrVE_jg13739 [Triparma verrucosa]